MELTSKSFLKIFLTLLILLCFITIAINVYVNPFGYYGDTVLGDGKVFNAQIAKYYHLKDMPSKPNTFVLGSSNSMRMKPTTIDSLFNCRAFNYGVYQASVEDFHCISHAIIEDLKIKPKMMIICIDDWNFSNYKHPKDEVFVGAQNRLAYKPQLSVFLKDYSIVKLFWCRLKSALAFEQLKFSYSNLLEGYKDGNISRSLIKMSHAFYENGVRKRYGDEEGRDVTDLAESGNYKISEYLKKKHETALLSNKLGKFKSSHENFEFLQPERIELFEELISFLNDHDVKVIINIMPVQPYVQEIIRQHGNYDKRVADLTTVLTNLKVKYKNILIVKDNHEIERFNGLPEQFFDDIHPTSVNSDSMIVSIKKELKYAF